MSYLAICYQYYHYLPSSFQTFVNWLSYVWCNDRVVGRFFMVSGRDGDCWVKMSATMVHRPQKIKKKYWLKRPKVVPKKTKFGPKYKWLKISHLEFFFLTILFRACNFFIFVHTFWWTSSDFFLIRHFLTESLKVNNY